MKLLFYLHVTLSMHFKCDIKTCTLLDTFHNTINNDTNVIIKETDLLFDFVYSVDHWVHEQFFLAFEGDAIFWKIATSPACSGG